MRSTAAPPGLAIFLHRGAGHRAVGAVHTAIAGLGPQDGMAGLAFIEPLAGIRGHALGFAVAALRTRQDGVQDHFSHLAAPVTVEG